MKPFNELDREVWLDAKYPLTIIADRYSGVYSGGLYVAFPYEYNEIDPGPDASDVECELFWKNYDGYVGLGSEPDLAFFNLMYNIEQDITYKYKSSLRL